MKFCLQDAGTPLALMNSAAGISCTRLNQQDTSILRREAVISQKGEDGKGRRGHVGVPGVGRGVWVYIWSRNIVCMHEIIKKLKIFYLKRDGE